MYVVAEARVASSVGAGGSELPPLTGGSKRSRGVSRLRPGSL